MIKNIFDKIMIKNMIKMKYFIVKLINMLIINFFYFLILFLNIIIYLFLQKYLKLRIK